MRRPQSVLHVVVTFVCSTLAAGVAPVERCVEEGHFELADFLVKWAERHGVRMGDE